jgi:hypothetical protein
MKEKTRSSDSAPEEARETLGQEIVTALENLNATETLIQQEFGELIGAPDKRQKQDLEDLGRLFHSLRGPERMLDTIGYSRPSPPRPPRRIVDK